MEVGGKKQEVRKWRREDREDNREIRRERRDRKGERGYDRIRGWRRGK